jgi:hypothetical protein
MAAKTQKQRRRPSADWVVRCRAWTWYAALMAQKFRRDDDLDLLIPGSKPNPKPDERLRAFARIRRLGHDPGTPHQKSGRETLVDAFDVLPHYRGSARIYKSLFWKLLTPPGLGADATSQMVAKLLVERELYRASPAEAAVGRTVFPKEEAFSPLVSVTTTYRKLVQSLADTGDIDDLALLSALYREAVHSFAIGHAEVLLGAVYEAAGNFVVNMWLADDARLLFHALIHRRIVGNNWAGSASKEAEDWVRARYPASSIRGPKLHERRIKIHAFNLERNYGAAHRPIVDLDNKMKKNIAMVHSRLDQLKRSSNTFEPDAFGTNITADVESINKRFSPVDMSVEDSLDYIGPLDGKRKRRLT